MFRFFAHFSSLPPPKIKTLPSSAMESAPTQTPSTEATIDSSNPIVSATIGDGDSSCHNNGEAETSAITAVTATPMAEGSEGPEEVKDEELADELIEKGSRAVKDGDYVEAAECFSRALEIRVACYGELALECVNSYYKYGCALLYKAQEEADPLAAVPRKEAGGQASDKDGTSKETLNGESSVASVSSNVGGDGISRDEDGAVEDGSGEEEQEEDGKESDPEDLAEADEDESDLDLAWKMLDIARAILDKHSVETVEKVDVLSALAEVALEREDIETSLSDYMNALSILEKLVEPDSRQIAELNFRICLCLEIGSKPEAAIPYCEKAISICKSRVQRLTDEIKICSESASDVDADQSSSVSCFDTTLADKESEIHTLEGLSAELEKKLEDLQQLAANPTSIFSEILGIASAKAKEMEKASSSAVMSSSRVSSYNCSGGFDSPTISTAHTNGTSSGVTDLGVVGRGVKRVLMNSGAVQPSPTKKPQLELPEEKRDGNAS